MLPKYTFCFLLPGLSPLKKLWSFAIWEPENAIILLKISCFENFNKITNQEINYKLSTWPCYWIKHVGNYRFLLTIFIHSETTKFLDLKICQKLYIFTLLLKINWKVLIIILYDLCYQFVHDYNYNFVWAYFFTFKQMGFLGLN